MAAATLEPDATLERLRAELAEERRANALLRAMIEHFPNGSLTLFDRELRVIAGGGRTGPFEPIRLVGKTLAEICGPKEVPPLEAAYRETLEGTGSVVEETRVGDQTHLVSRHPVHGEDGGVAGVVVVTQDITERVATEAALRESEERHRLLFEKAGEAICLWSMDTEDPGAVLDVNDAALAMYGYTREEIVGKHHDLVLAPGQEALREQTRRSARAGAWVRARLVHVKKDGTRFPIDAMAGPVVIGGKRRILSFCYDMTERVAAEEALREAMGAADAANRAKSVFLANMSHEIRTPMNAIVGYAQLLQRDPALGEAQRAQIGIIQRAGDHLLALINDVLEISKIEAGHRSLHLRDVDFVTMVGEVERMFELKARAKGLSFAVRVEPGVPRRIVGDEGRLTQVLVNLIGNAVKFTASGAVTVRAAVEGEGGEARLVVEVEDTGPGIEPEMLGALFKPFSQARAGIEAQGGTGLGLAISREYARMMGGDITFTSRAGTGSLFRFAVPCAESRAPTLAPPVPAGRVVGIEGAGDPCRILIVDDDEDHRGWVRLLLLQIGFEVREARNGLEGLALFTSWRPRLVLMDVNMPVMNGLDAMRAIRALPGGAPVAILAVTASAFDDEQDAILAAGADAVLRKPCREGELLEDIGRRLGLAYVRAAAIEAAHAAAPSPAGGLSPELALALRDAAHVADYERLMELIARVPAEHDAEASALRAMTERYAYEEIEARLRA
jgi:PAS domain S-box-containing protein